MDRGAYSNSGRIESSFFFLSTFSASPPLCECPLFGLKTSIKSTSLGPNTPPWVDRLRRGAPISDRAFDQIFPPSARELSRVHWTPLEVVRRATALLTDLESGHKILDVGSGVGKFCLAGALISPAQFYGVEQREHFVKTAQELSFIYDVSRAHFIHGNLEDLDWSGLRRGLSF